jgi:hypothetical protein
MVRRLNAAGVRREAEVLAVKQEMLASVERMAEHAERHNIIEATLPATLAELAASGFHTVGGYRLLPV